MQSSGRLVSNYDSSIKHFYNILFLKGFILYFLMYVFLTLLQVVCHGCGFKVESQSTNEEQFTSVDGKMVTVTICEDCKKDLDAPGKGCFMSLLEKKL